MATVHRWPHLLGYGVDVPTFTVEFTSSIFGNYRFETVEEMMFVMRYIEPVLEGMRNEAKTEQGWRKFITDHEKWSPDPPYGGPRL